MKLGIILFLNRFLKIIVSGMALAVVVFAGLFFLSMDDPITDDDTAYAHLLLANYNVDTSAIKQSLQSELNFIRSVQRAVQLQAPTKDCIPKGHERNIKDIYKLKCGMCYDKSHVTEKILQIYGFETRHISIYYYKFWYEKFWTLFLPRSGSHAVSEVKTKGGWLFFDSVSEINGISANNTVLSLGDIRTLLKNGKTTQDLRRLFSFKHNFIYLYGMYSRNGYLYPPYNFIPDFKLKELKYNLIP